MNKIGFMSCLVFFLLSLIKSKKKIAFLLVKENEEKTHVLYNFNFVGVKANIDLERYAKYCSNLDNRCKESIKLFYIKMNLPGSILILSRKEN